MAVVALQRELDAYQDALDQYQRESRQYRSAAKTHNAAADAYNNSFVQTASGQPAVYRSGYRGVGLIPTDPSAPAISGSRFGAPGYALSEISTGHYTARYADRAGAPHPGKFTQVAPDTPAGPDPTKAQMNKLNSQSLASQERGLISDVIKGGGVK